MIRRRLELGGIKSYTQKILRKVATVSITDTDCEIIDCKITPGHSVVGPMPLHIIRLVSVVKVIIDLCVG